METGISEVRASLSRHVRAIVTGERIALTARAERTALPNLLSTRYVESSALAAAPVR
jgi:hypothetical protein